MFGIQPLPSKSTPKLIDILTTLGLTTNLKVCVDAGDSNSVTTSIPSTWEDVSGQNNDLTIGTAPPQFRGTVGGLSSNEYMRTISEGCLTTSQTWADSAHNNNALVSIFVAMKKHSDGTLFTTANSSLPGSSTGFTYKTNPQVQVTNASGTEALLKTADVGSETATACYGLSLNEGGGNVSFFWKNGSYDQVSAANTFDASYASPSAGIPDRSPRYFGYFVASWSSVPDANVYAMAIWVGTALTKDNLDAIFGMIRGRFSL